MKKERPRAMITIEANNAEELRSSIILLKLGCGELLTGRAAEPREAGGPHAFLGVLEISDLPSPTPFLLALARQLLLGPAADRNIAAVAGRIWLASHCSLCGRPVEEAEQTALADALCLDCASLSLEDSGITHRTERVTMDQAAILAFMRDPDVSDQERDQFYLQYMAREIAAAARNGYQLHGRGALVLDQTGARPFSGYYVDEITARETGVGWPSPEVESMVRDYDPRQELIVVFLRSDGRPTTYQIHYESGPPEGANPFHPEQRTANTA